MPVENLDLRKFVSKYNFDIMTTSSHYPKSNCLAENL